MSDYLRARVEALTNEVERLKERVELLEAKLDVANSQIQQGIAIDKDYFTYNETNTL